LFGWSNKNRNINKFIFEIILKLIFIFLK
jgi:hypothetical protein